MFDNTGSVGLCIKDYRSSNYLYVSGSNYRIVKIRNHYDYFRGEGVYYELVNSSNHWCGYVLDEDFEKYFIIESEVISDIDSVFNNIMDG